VPTDVDVNAPCKPVQGEDCGWQVRVRRPTGLRRVRRCLIVVFFLTQPEKKGALEITVFVTEAAR